MPMTGMMLILSWSCFMNSMSRGFRPCPDGATKYRQACTLGRVARCREKGS